ncbi:hypothetical protein E5S69_29445 [Cupriavidus necator]|nr:hypothetical protein [Cupriavidus necator]
MTCLSKAAHRRHAQRDLKLVKAEAFALPAEVTARGIRRYGFHGLSYQYIASVLPRACAAAGRAVVAHLGNGSSMCALLAGRSVASTMGFTAVDGLRVGRFSSPAATPLQFLNSCGASYIFEGHSGSCRRAGRRLSR